MFDRIQLALPILVLALASACRSTTLVNSLDDLTAQVDQEGFLTLEQQRILSLSGLAPGGEPGTVYRFRGSRSPFTAVGVSKLCDESGKLASYYVERTIEYPEPENGTALDELIDLRDRLIQVRLEAAELIRTRLELLAARAAEPPDADRIDELVKASDAAQNAFDEAWIFVNERVSRPGVMIIRTNKRTTTSLASRIGSILGFSTTRNRESGGFAILGSLRTSFLYLGNDLHTDRWAHPPGRDWSLVGTRFPYILSFDFPFLGQWSYEDCMVVTSKFEARWVLYARDQLSESRIQSKLEAAFDDVEELGKIEDVVIDAVLSSVESLGNTGILGPMETRIVPLEKALSVGEQSTPASWQPVYQVLSDYNDLHSFALGRWRMHLTRFF